MIINWNFLEIKVPKIEFMYVFNNKRTRKIDVLGRGYDMRIGRILACGLVAVAVLWGTIIFKVMDTEEFFKSHLEDSTIITAESNHYVGQTEAGKIMESKISGANLFSIESGSDGTRAIYKGGLQKGNTEYTIIMDAKTGDVISIESKEITSELAEKMAQENAEAEEESTGANQTSNNKSTSSKSSSNNTTTKSTKTTNNSSKQASTSSQKSTTSNYISSSKASKIMQNKASGARVISLRRDGSRYKGVLKKGDTRYKITLSAKTGKVLDFDRDYNYYDNDDDDDDDEDDDDDDEDDDD